MNALITRPYSWLRHNVGHLLYERRYGVRTSGKVLLNEFGLDEADRVYYIPANWRTLRRTLPRDEVSTSDVFIDFGSGMGRMVIEAAARYPFRRVIGIELAEELNQIARRNVDGTRLRLQCEQIELVRADALEYEIPDDVSVVFMNNPFRGPVFAQVITNLIASVDRNPRQLRLIYFNPVEEDFLLGTGRFQPLRTVTQPRHKPGTLFGLTRVYLLTAAAAVA